MISGAPKVLLDALLSDITVVAGEPFRIKVPFKGSPAPLAKWFNVRFTTNKFHHFIYFKYNWKCGQKLGVNDCQLFNYAAVFLNDSYIGK